MPSQLSLAYNITYRYLVPQIVTFYMIFYIANGRVQAEGDKLKTPKFGKLFELLITFEIVSQSQKSLVHSWVIVVRTGCHSQILLITPNLRLTAVFVTFTEGSFAIITFDLEP